MLIHVVENTSLWNPDVRPLLIEADFDDITHIVDTIKDKVSAEVFDIIIAPHLAKSILSETYDNEFTIFTATDDIVLSTLSYAADRLASVFKGYRVIIITTPGALSDSVIDRLDLVRIKWDGLFDVLVNDGELDHLEEEKLFTEDEAYDICPDCAEELSSIKLSDVTEPPVNSTIFSIETLGLDNNYVSGYRQWEPDEDEVNEAVDGLFEELTPESVSGYRASNLTDNEKNEAVDGLFA